MTNNGKIVTVDGKPKRRTYTGDISYFGNYKLYTFRQSGKFTLNTQRDVSVLVVGGGGNGGDLSNSGGAGGGGGGQVIITSILNCSTGTYDIQVGEHAEDSTFNGIIAFGGEDASIFYTTKGGDSGSGFLGGISLARAGGGGGGDSSIGEPGKGPFPYVAGDGGRGTKCNITGIDVSYGGGGGGSTAAGITYIGLGYDGGGNGSYEIQSGFPTIYSDAVGGRPNSGGGGGGQLTYVGQKGGTGASGVVIIRHTI